MAKGLMLIGLILFLLGMVWYFVRREPLNKSLVAETLTLRPVRQGGSRRQCWLPLASDPTPQGGYKVASHMGLVALACSLRCVARPIATAWDLRTAPRDLCQSDANSAHKGLIQRFLSWIGRLPGDIRFESDNTRVFLPITSMILISLVLTLLFNLFQR